MSQKQAIHISYRSHHHRIQQEEISLLLNLNELLWQQLLRSLSGWKGQQ
jgi:hypothetical protein